MREVLKNIWDWIDLYAWTLVAIALIILSIIFIVCEISITVSQKKMYKKQMEKHEQEEHDEIAQIVEAQRIYASSKNKKVCKKCVNCKHFVNDCVCLYKGVLAVGSREIANRFNNCEYFEAKDL